ncbi:hypothetical protein [Streptomyces incanus]|uniref:Uncharacterized protein n=1 Tax=Streptomyces incanus TaxID=887453 RepID=A0ABW0XUT0_9ACTN
MQRALGESGEVEEFPYTGPHPGHFVRRLGRARALPHHAHRVMHPAQRERLHPAAGPGEQLLDELRPFVRGLGPQGECLLIPHEGGPGPPSFGVAGLDDDGQSDPLRGSPGPGD